MARDQRQVFIWTFIYLGLQNFSWDFQVRENGVHLKNTFPFTWISPASFDRKYLRFPSIKLNGFFTKTKEAILGDSMLYSVSEISFLLQEGSEYPYRKV
jgi:hypothetical protein